MKSTLFIKSTISIVFILLLGYGCFDDLNTLPIDPDVATSNNVYENPASYEQVLAKIYAGLALTGQEGPAGKPDIEGIDEGFGQYLRMYWYHQELSTDESVIAWNDQTIKDFHAKNGVPMMDSSLPYTAAFSTRFPFAMNSSGKPQMKSWMVVE